MAAKLELINKLIELSDYARKGDPFFPDEVCNFLANELELNAVALFQVKHDNLLEVIGRSQSTGEKYFIGFACICNTCSLLNQKKYFTLSIDSECEIQISDSLTNESCCLIQLPNNENFLIKFASKAVLALNDKEQIEKFLQIITVLLISWTQGRGGNVKLPLSSLSNIVSDTAQELKNLSNSLLGGISFLTNESLSSTQSAYISSIKKNAQSILLNINDLSNLAKIESNTLTNDFKKVHLLTFVNEILKVFKSRLGNKKISFNVNIEKSLRGQISVDEKKLKYILTTLLFISTTLTSEGEISLNVSSVNDNKIRFYITDTGIALEKETVKRFFEPYMLSKKDEFKNKNISGLNLTLLKSYVNYLSGEINVTSVAGKGNSFTFTISGEIMLDFENGLSQLPKPSLKNKILVIEDDYATSKLLSNYLNKWGYNPIIVSTESQAFSIIDKEQLLAVILDIELPNVNGLELLKKIHDHQNTKNVPVIVCSVEPEQQKAFLLGAVEYFIKPINYNYLVEVLTSYKLRKDSNVLCVDDDLPTLNLVKQAIESAGFNAIAESISTNVMDLIKNKDIDLAIVDLDMPDLNGFDLIKLIKSEKKYAHLPIIIYTGKENYKEDLYKIEGLFEELLDKRSTNIEDLADTINVMINSYEVPPPREEVIKKENVIKILLAEDYKHSQIIVTRLLKKNNFENIVVVENGEDACKIASQEKFDLILMDMQMPIMNGFEATEKIREIPDYKDVPIIALTAFAMKGDREKCLEVGATDYIPKPIDSKEFIEKVMYYTNSTA